MEGFCSKEDKELTPSNGTVAGIALRRGSERSLLESMQGLGKTAGSIAVWYEPPWAGEVMYEKTCDDGSGHAGLHGSVRKSRSHVGIGRVKRRQA
jgi:hypothetical protein